MRNSPHKLVTSVLKCYWNVLAMRIRHLYHLPNYYTRVTKTENGVFKSKSVYLAKYTHLAFNKW